MLSLELRLRTTLTSAHALVARWVSFFFFSPRVCGYLKPGNSAPKTRQKSSIWGFGGLDVSVGIFREFLLRLQRCAYDKKCADL